MPLSKVSAFIFHQYQLINLKDQERSERSGKIRLLLHHLRQVLTANFEDSPAKLSQAASDEISKCAP
jgi:hypothetical protein